MKKYNVAVFLAVAAVGIFGIISSLGAGEILYVEGSVQVQPSGQESEWVKAEKGMRVNEGDKIRTARHSVADVALDDQKQNSIRIEPKTLVVLNSGNAGLIDRLDLSRGKVYSKVENLKSGLSFEVSTPSSVAGVRGSAFSVYAESDTDEIQALKDSAFVQAYDADGNLITELTLPEGFKTFVDRFEGPSALIQVTLREFSRFDGITEDLTAHEQGNMESRRERERAAQEAAKGTEPNQIVGEQSQILEEISDQKLQDKESALDKTIESERHDSHYEW